ncbi:MAG: SulP family inorganic anion transporter [Rubrivivax sp.]
MRIPLHPFRPRLLSSLQGYDRRRLGADIGAGVTVGIVALPLAMAFAIASGVKPEAGLFTAIIAGFLISALGGSHVQIGGPAGAFIVIVYGIVERYGLANLLISTALAGVLLFLMGWLRLGALIRYIPVSIVIGFTNGIAVLIGLSQVKDLLGLEIDKLPADFFTQIGVLASHLHTLNPAALVMGLSCLAVVVLWPKSYALEASVQGGWARLRRTVALLPGTMVALVGATLLTAAFSLPLETIGSRFGGIPQSLPSLALPVFSWGLVQQLLIPTVTIAMLGAIESLLCARVADNLSDLPRHDPNQELMAQGVANVVSPLFGGIPATGTIARTVTNVRAGATSPVAGMVHSVTLLVVVLLAAPLALHVPLAALAGILLFVAWNMGEWREFVKAWRFHLTYRTVLFGTFVLTVMLDLTVAVQVGLVLACVFFIWRMGSLFQAHERPPADRPAGLDGSVQVFDLYGALFFGAVAQVEDLPERMTPGTRQVALDMHRLVSMDASGLEALRQLHRSLRRKGVGLVLVDANEQPLSLIRRSGFDRTLGPDGLVSRWEEAVQALQAAARAAAPGPTLPEPPMHTTRGVRSRPG